ncbi:hypothetical protein LPJ78_003366 [Coemansia sp. RSA 989]|nr:hypothetical protein BX667DRAFT_516063 [Coemansia mojavensis]KAJ1738972.1 hypothetical protein LPJ68_005091 [Coemansia sp. RSA 1086]KAJ1747420.1 hypothetical protein LPJ79_005259 [Coemansia sp. RSA 1821]KAJ1864412.1 hypothetical protein LPJ78_003366 [Coemansia sp. RSA 989]KAJ1869461.1 hypothetical protein LPJ55_005344 [Coemansia sp. RSA 990]KAJ2668945.1 hypothetical protein IWW42_004871 [Coemansia sp. RSA 1085]
MSSSKRPSELAGSKKPHQKRAKRYQYLKDRARNPQNSFDISPGMKGFFVTCTRGREKKSAAETIDLLEEYTGKLYPNLDEEIAAEKAASEDRPAAEGEGDIEDEIARELAEMQSSPKIKMFRYLPTTVDCLLYIKCHRKIDPEKLVQFMFADLAQTRQRKTRFTSRLIPAQVTTTSRLDAIVRDSKQVVQRLLAEDAEPTTFALVVNIRYCADLKREEVIAAVAAPLDVKHKVDLKNARFTLVIEVFKSMATIGLVENYNELRRLNLQTLFDEPSAETLPKSPVAAADA